MPFRIIRNTTAGPIADVVVKPDINVPSGEVVFTHMSGQRGHMLGMGIPTWNGGSNNEEQKLRECYEKSLKYAEEFKLGSIAFKYSTLIENHFPEKKTIEIAVAAFTGFLENNDMDIILVVSGDKDEKISEELFSEVREYVDGQYDSRLIDEEGRFFDAFHVEEKNFTSSHEMPLPAAPAPLASERELRGYDLKHSIFGRAMKARKAGLKKASGLSKNKHSESEEMGATPLSMPLAELTPEESLDDVIKGIYKETFEKHLQMLINKKGLKNSEVYAAANISKQYFSKLLKGQVKPSKEKMLALAVGLRLNLDETIDFLAVAGYALSPISQTDTIVKYFILNEDYSVIKIDIVLYDYGLDPLS